MDSSPSSSALDMPMENNWEYVHGRIDPGIEKSLSLVETVPEREPKRLKTELGNRLSQQLGEATLSHMDISMASPSNHAMSNICHLTAMPSEIIEIILSHLGPVDLACISLTCRLLFNCSKSDYLWKRHVQNNVPGVVLPSEVPPTNPCQSYRDLYAIHDPRWFLPKNKIWFSDKLFLGHIIIARLNIKTGIIEAYQLVASRPPPTFDHWEDNDEVIIHSFTPDCHLHMNTSTIQLDPTLLQPSDTVGIPNTENRFAAEISMGPGARGIGGIFTNFFCARSIKAERGMELWPPRNIPSDYRVRSQSQQGFVGSGHKPQKRSQLCDKAFRIRKWSRMQYLSSSDHRNEGVSTYATLEPELYTPTEEKPFRGIWVGDYSGHGCEFLLMHQPDNVEPFDESTVVRGEDETVEEWEVRKKEERIYRGSLEAIKLTGDANIPRGEHTFIVDDLGPDGFVRRSEGKTFQDARIVRSRGHIANRGFRDDTYIKSHLIIISTNRIAQYWEEFGHISFFERVDIDKLLDPENDPVNPEPNSLRSGL